MSSVPRRDSGLDGHSMPHAATFRNADDPSRGEVQRELENLLKRQAAAAGQISPRTRLKTRLASCSAFKQARPQFLAMLAADATEDYLQEQQVMFYVDTPIAHGTTPFYVVLEGQMSVENRLEVGMGFVREGEIFGEGGALGLTEERTATMRASKGRPSIVLRIEGATLEEALISYPEERDALEEIFYKRLTKNQEFEKQRLQWAEQTIVPALGGTALLAGCPDDFLYNVAAPLTEKSFKDGQTIAVCGDPADSMLLLMEGTAEIQAKSGAKIAHLREGATISEVAALDLFPCRMATIKSVGRSRVLSITHQALSSAIANSPEQMVKVAFSKLVESRHEQVRRGMPMCALPINARPEDVSVRAVALQAERIDLAPGQIWYPLPDSDACGPHFGVLVKGKAVLETSEERRLVTALIGPSIYPEGMAAEYDTHLRAVTHCEGYRVRQNDFLVAVFSMPSAQEWFYRFKLLDKSTRAHLGQRLSAVRGVTEAIRKHPSQKDIHDWSNRRQKAIARASRLKVEGGNSIAKLPSMARTPVTEYLFDRGSSQFGGGGADPRRGMNRVGSAPELSTRSRPDSTGGLSGRGGSRGASRGGYGGDDMDSSLRLPRLQTAG